MTENNSPDSKKVEISLGEHNELQKVKLIQEVKQEILSWLKNWTIILTIIFALIGLIGTNVLVASVIRGFIDKDIEEAQRASFQAQDTSERAKKDMEEAIEQAEKYSGRIQKLDEQALSIKDQLDGFSALIKASSQNVKVISEFSIKKLQEQIENLNNELIHIAKNIEPSSARTTKFQVTQMEIREEAEEQKTKLDENSLYRVTVWHRQKNLFVDKITKVLRDDGFIVGLRFIKPRFFLPPKNAQATKEGKILIQSWPGKKTKADEIGRHLNKVLNIGFITETMRGKVLPNSIYIYLPD